MDNLQLFFKKWITTIVIVIIVIIVIHLIIVNQKKELRTDGDQPSADGNGSLFYLGRGSEDDSIETLLQRTSWSAYLTKRKSRWERTILITIITEILLIGIYWRKIPPIMDLVVTSVIIFFVVHMVPNFLYTHGDIYNDANIRNNTHLIAKKLGLDVNFGADLPVPTNSPPDRLDVM